MEHLSTVLEKALERPVNTACTLIESLLGNAFMIAGDALSDEIRYWQWRNRIRIMDRSNAVLAKRGLPPRKLNPDFLLPFIRDSGDISDETLQETWSKLLVAAIDDEEFEHIAFVNTLRNLSGTDVRVLQALISLGYLEPKARAARITEHLQIPEKQVQLSIYNIEHLGFFTPTQKRLKGYALTFLKACLPDPTAVDRYQESQANVKSTLVMD